MRDRSLGHDVVAVLASYLVVGVLAGLVWWWVWEPAVFTKVQGGGSSMGEVELGKQFAADGWYAVVAALAGLCSGVALTAWRSRDFLATVPLVVVGSLLAAAVMAGTGALVGPGDVDVALAAAQVGDKVPVQLDVAAASVYLIWPIATLVGALIVLWSPPEKSSEKSPEKLADESPDGSLDESVR